MVGTLRTEVEASLTPLTPGGDTLSGNTGTPVDGRVLPPDTDTDGEPETPRSDGLSMRVPRLRVEGPPSPSLPVG